MERNSLSASYKSSDGCNQVGVPEDPLVSRSWDFVDVLPKESSRTAARAGTSGVKDSPAGGWEKAHRRGGRGEPGERMQPRFASNPTLPRPSRPHCGSGTAALQGEVGRVGHELPESEIMQQRRCFGQLRPWRGVRAQAGTPVSAPVSGPQNRSTSVWGRPASCPPFSPCVSAF